jgi:hypothetical protein
LFGFNLNNADIGVDNFRTYDRSNVKRPSFRVEELNGCIRLGGVHFVDNMRGSHKVRITGGEASAKDVTAYAIIFLPLLLERHAAAVRAAQDQAADMRFISTVWPLLSEDAKARARLVRLAPDDPARAILT